MLKIYRFLKPYTAMIAAVLGLVFLQTLSDLYLPTLMSNIINDGVMHGDTTKIMQIGGLMLLVGQFLILQSCSWLGNCSAQSSV